MLRSFLILFASIALIPTSACAHNFAPASAGGYSLQLEDQYGNALSTYHHKGATYVLGNYNTRYNVRITNHTGARVEAVLTVDGRDAVSGDVGNYKTQRGYVIDPYGSIVVDGFRKSLSKVAAFRFTTPGDSYSSRRGTPQNVGVVGVAIFKERAPIQRPRPRPMPLRKHSSSFDFDDAPISGTAEAAPGSGGLSARHSAKGRHASRPAPSAQKNNLGTRYGETRHSPVVEVPFKRARQNRPHQILSAYYDDHGGLAARGIIVHGHASANPQPFPNNRRFAPPPAP